MLKLYRSKLFDLYDGKWFKELNYCISFERRKMFLKNGEINPHFDASAFEKTVNYNLLYISYIEDDDDIDCMSFGFGQLEFDVREEIYKMFLYDNCTATALLRISKDIAFNDKNAEKVFTDEYFDHYITALDTVNGKNEKYLTGIIYSDDRLNMSDRGFSDDISCIDTIMKKSEMILLKAPHYGGYDYVVFYSDNSFGIISEVCTGIEKLIQ